MPQAGSQIVKSGLTLGSGFMTCMIELDQHTRSEVLARPLLPFTRRLFQQSLEGRALHVHIQGRPILFIDQVDDAS